MFIKKIKILTYLKKLMFFLNALMHFDNSKFTIELQKFIHYLTKMTNSIGQIIGGKVVKEDGKSFGIFNPSNGKCIALATNASKKIIDTRNLEYVKKL